ncbi:HET-domain-containing protein, partial [Lophium mytilinum]
MALALRQFQQAGQQFSYHHLCHGRREIRLLDLLPGLPLQPIECELRVVALDDKPEYEALSYVWGDPTRLTTVSLLGVPFRITKSLESALRRLRNPTKTRTLWVDAICINQSNDTERTEQMGRMREIFSQTTECAIWFG